MIRVRVRRGRDSNGFFRDLTITCDAAKVAELRPGKAAEFTVDAGPHQFMASMDWATSELLEVDVADGATLNLFASFPWRGMRPLFKTIPQRSDPRDVDLAGAIVLRRE